MNKKVYVIAIIFLLIAGFVFSVDFGGLIHNETGFAAGGSEPGGGATFKQLDLASIWFNSGVHHKVVFYAGGSYTFTLERPYLFDIYSFKLLGTFPREDTLPTEFSFTLGRYHAADFTGSLFSHNLDGIHFDFTYPAVQVHTDIGFAGFQFKPTSTMLLTKPDYNDQNIDSVILGPKRLVTMAEIDFTNLFKRQQLSIGFLAQEDFRYLFETDNTNTLSKTITEGETAFTPERGGLLDTQYFLLGMEGPILSGFFYNVFGVLNTGRTLSYINGVYTYSPIIGFAAGFNVRYYNERGLYSRADLGFTFASGDYDYTVFLEGNTEKRSTLFIPPSTISTGTVFSPVLSNIFYMNASYSLKPLSFLRSDVGNRLKLGVEGLLFFRSTPTPISISGTDPSSDSLYLGTELDAGIDFRLFSDLGFSIVAGWFFPSNVFPDKQPAWFLGKITASLQW